MVEVVAELSGNHGGRIENAFRLIEEAKKASADAVKFQCFWPPALAKKRVGIVWHGKAMTCEELEALYWKTWTPREWFPSLIGKCNDIGIAWFSSVFSPVDVAFLEELDCPRYKISAYEMLDGDLINAVVKTGKPIIMSARPTERVTILLATDYEGNAGNFGLSDHSQDADDWWPDMPMVERHLKLPDVPCEDEEFSSTPDEFRLYVKHMKSWHEPLDR